MDTLLQVKVEDMQSHNSQRPNRFQSIFTPYGLTLDLEDHFHCKFETEEFYNIVDAIATADGQEDQIAVFNLFKTLSRVEVIDRSKTVSRLYKALLNIQIRKGSNDIQSSYSGKNTTE